MGEELSEADPYQDVGPALAALREKGLRVAIAGNRTAHVGQLLREPDLPVDEIATSGEWGVAKPDPRFFARVLDLVGTPPDKTVYVGDHPANDIRPAKAAGQGSADVVSRWG